MGGRDGSRFGFDLPSASPRDTLKVLRDVVVPTVSKGVIIRRPRMVAMAKRLDLDRRAVHRMQRLRRRYAPGPLLLPIPKRTQALVLEPEHVHRVLQESPEPFATATLEKRRALAHFEPKGALISRGEKREERRRFNEEVLDHGEAVHRLAENFVRVVREEAGRMLGEARRNGGLGWEEFSEAWFRMVRRVVFGEGAAEDQELSRLMARLRRHGNWALLALRRRGLQRRFFQRLNGHLARGEPGTLAQVIATAHKTPETAPDHQVPQWLFAFDPAGMATFRALGLLSTHPEQAARAQQEIEEGDGGARRELPFLRASVLESLRLWPTTPLVLRETTRPTEWETGVMPEGTSVVIFAPYFHRDDERLPWANRFFPELWMDGVDQEREWPLIPFSEGPAVCPGRHLVLLVASHMLASLLGHRQVWSEDPERLDPARPLPGTLNNYSLRFEVDG